MVWITAEGNEKICKSRQRQLMSVKDALFPGNIIKLYENMPSINNVITEDNSFMLQ